jgi:hypothetical protein
MNLNFNQEGFLEPIGLIECDLATLEKYFVDNFPNSTTRKRLFINYLRYLESFKSRVTRNFTQWINGSFVSQKENPKDIDLVTFFDFEVFEAQEPFLGKYWSFNLENEGLDAYLAKVYPESHPNHYLTLEKFDYFTNLYHSKTIDDVEYFKGFLQLKFK